jgi:hypothetical protein
VPVFHKGVFRGILRLALRGLTCFQHDGRYFEPLESGPHFAIYRRAPDVLSRLRERVDDYEFTFYKALLIGRCGRDGDIRPHTLLWRQPGGGYRAFRQRNGETL